MLKKPMQLMAKCKWTSDNGDKISDHKPCVHSVACSYNCLHHIPILQSRGNEQRCSTKFILNTDISSFADKISHKCGICLKTDKVICNTVFIYIKRKMSAISPPSQSNTL
jgi:hypothetical protein